MGEKSQMQALERTQPLLPIGFGYVEGVTHKHGKVKAWLARNPRVHTHFTATYSSWLHQVERWFALIAERAIRRNSFTSVRELKQQIDLFVQRQNADASPFRWVATADSILQKIEKIAKRISAPGH